MRKEASEPTNTATIGTVANTFLNPFASIMPGKWWVPKGMVKPTLQETYNPKGLRTGNVKYDKLLFHGGAVATSALALTALARLLGGHFRDKKRDEERKKELAEVVSAKNPIFSPDPYLDDMEEEEKNLMLGVGKEAADLYKEADSLPDWLKAIVPLSLMIGGGVVGYKSIDNILERKKSKELNNEVDELSNEYDRLAYLRLMQARGMSPEEAPAPQLGLPKEEDTLEGPMPKVASDEERTQEESHWNTLKSISALVLLSTAVSSGILSKRYFDSVDPKRAELAEMDHALKTLSQQEVKNQPIDIAPISPALQRQLDAHLNQTGSKKPAAIESHALPARTIESTPVELPSSGISVDKSDPTMAIL
jgi:hypothetical protein